MNHIFPQATSGILRSGFEKKQTEKKRVKTNEVDIEPSNNGV